MSQEDAPQLELAGVEEFGPEGAPLLADPSPESLTAALVAAGVELGFSRVGVASVEPLQRGRERLEAFRARGFAGEMDYLQAGERHDPSALLPGAKSALVVLFAHGDPTLIPATSLVRGLRGRVARYAQGNDYHLFVRDRLFDLARRAAALSGQPVRARACVDTAPLLERELAARAGLGFQGKSTLLIAPGVGSYGVLGELLLDLELSPTRAALGGCGSCRACLDACPTAAFADEYVLDARRCISYLTIEQEGAVPRELRAAIGDRVFGCDVCQETCPFNASPSRPQSSALGRRDGLRAPDLIELLQLGSAGYRKLVKRTALRRASRTTLQRNAAIALGNSRDASAVPPLCATLSEHARPVVRLHAAWALGELSAHGSGTLEAARALEHAAEHDSDAEVRAESRHALERAQGSAAGASSAR
ncbi:MAG: tRNA epoxyqueuosine(34) reductase QueG [Polyangiaceae bacterium]